ncbi:MAG TPA: 30S ribosomal protein S6 [Myxococcales bacterium]|nr:30S ribosomal protein S6 [Myxococcales bacterium]
MRAHSGPMEPLHRKIPQPHCPRRSPPGVIRQRARALKAPVQEEESSVREYELNIIIQPEISEEGSAAILGRLDALLEESSATRLLCDDIGKRKLAYEIDRFQKGHYYLLSFLDAGPVVSELEGVLRLEESVLRFLTVKVDDDVVDVEARVAAAKEREEELAKRAAEKANREAEDAKARAAAEALAAEKAAAAAAEKAEAASEAADAPADSPTDAPTAAPTAAPTEEAVVVGPASGAEAADEASAEAAAEVAAEPAGEAAESEEESS